MPALKKGRSTVRRKPTMRKRKSSSTPFIFAGLMVIIVMLSPFYYGFVVKLASSAWFWLRHPNEDVNYRTYESYRIKIPKVHRIHGIDVSYYQGKIDWERVSKMEDDGVRISFAFIKATEGILKVDPFFLRNWREAPKHGVKVGAYHFFRANKSGLWQANFFLQTASFEKGDLPPVVDVEGLDGVSADRLRIELNAFVVRVEEKVKVKPIIYSSLSFYRQYLKNYYPSYPFWLAHYHQEKLNLDKSAWKFWQHSDIARIDGINHVVDFNAFNGDSVAFEKLLIP